MMINSLYNPMMSSVYGSLDSDFRTDLLSPSGTNVDNPFPGNVSPNSIANFDLRKPLESYQIFVLDGSLSRCYVSYSLYFCIQV